MYYNSQCNTVLVGTLSFKVLAYDLLTHERLWSQSLQDSILCVTSWNTSTFVGVADGSVVVFEVKYPYIATLAYRKHCVLCSFLNTMKLA